MSEQPANKTQEELLKENNEAFKDFEEVTENIDNKGEATPTLPEQSNEKKCFDIIVDDFGVIQALKGENIIITSRTLTKIKENLKKCNKTVDDLDAYLKNEDFKTKFITSNQYIKGTSPDRAVNYMDNVVDLIEKIESQTGGRRRKSQKKGKSKNRKTKSKKSRKNKTKKRKY